MLRGIKPLQSSKGNTTTNLTMIATIQTGLALSLLFSLSEIWGVHCAVKELSTFHIQEPFVTELLALPGSYFESFKDPNSAKIKHLISNYVLVTLELERALSATVSSLLKSSKSLALKEALLKHYLQQGYNPNALRGLYGIPPLTEMVLEGKRDALTLLLENGANPNQPSVRGYSPFYEAVQIADLTFVQLLIAAGADVSKPVALDPDGTAIVTPLSMAATQGYHEIVTVLLAAGAEPNCPLTACGETALIYAVRKGSIETVRALLRAGAKQPIIFMGETPLSIALEAEHTDIANLLLDAGAAEARSSDADATPLYIAAIQGNLRLATLLVQREAPLNATTAIGNETALLAATEREHVNIVRLLLTAKARQDIAESSGKTPLYIAAERGSMAILKLLLACNPPLEAAAEDGFTPLLIAIKNGHTTIVDRLLKAQANFNATTRGGLSALDLARNHTAITRLLETSMQASKPEAKEPRQQSTLQSFIGSFRFKGDSQRVVFKASGRSSMQLSSQTKGIPLALRSSPPTAESDTVRNAAARRKPLTFSPTSPLAPAKSSGSKGEKRDGAQAGIQATDGKVQRR